MTKRNYNGEAMKTLTVGELIELLQGEDPDAKVIFATCYGDYHRTEQALPLRGEIDTVTIEKSAYSNSGFAIPRNDEADEDDEDYEPYLVIR